MIQNDFLMRQLAQFIQAIIGFVFKKKTTVTNEERQNYIKTGMSLLGVDEKFLFTTSGEELIDAFAEDGNALEKLETIAYLLLLDEQTRAINHKNTVKTLLIHVQKNSKTYSIQREEIIKSC